MSDTLANLGFRRIKCTESNTTAAPLPCFRVRAVMPTRFGPQYTTFVRDEQGRDWVVNKKIEKEELEPHFFEVCGKN